MSKQIRYASQQPEGFKNYIENVAIVGAAGHIGSEIVKYLLQGKKHKITALTRADSKAELPSGISVAKIDYDNPATMVDALRGQDVLIITLAVTAPRDTQSKLISAAASAGVPWIFPNEWSPDGANKQMLRDMMVGARAEAPRAQIEELGVSRWIGLSCGFWYEWSLPIGTGTFGFDIKNREAVFFDDGTQKISTSTWPQCGRAMAGLLSLKVLPEDESDKDLTLESFAYGWAYPTSFTVSQKDMFASLLRVTGTRESDWKISHEDSRVRWAKAKEEFEQGSRLAFRKTMYTRIFFPTGEGNLEQSGRKTLNGPLNLPKEDLDEYTKQCVDFVAAGKSWFG